MSKLAEAEATVDELSSEAHEQRVALTAKQAEVDEAMDAIEAAMEAASSRKAEVERLSTEQEQASEVAAQRKVLPLHFFTALDQCRLSMLKSFHNCTVLLHPA